MAQIRIPLMRSTFFDEATTKEKLIGFLRLSGRLSLGDECAKFEKAFAKYQERKHAVLVSNGSAANLGLIQAFLNMGKLKPGDSVGVSAITWATNVMPLLQLGLRPVALDCDLRHLNVTSKELKKHIGGLKSVFLTNVLGLCGDMEEIKKLCDEHGVLILEDNCESLGTRYQGKLLGNFGLASTFSFFVGHHLSTIEGGMICTDDEELYEQLLMVRSHGWDRNLPAKKQQALRKKHTVDDFHAKYTFYELAYNIRPTEITGFLGNVQLPMLEKTVERREQNFRRFLAAVSKHPDLYHQLSTGHIERISSFSMPVITKSKDILEKTIRRFDGAGVEVRPVIAGDITRHPFWKKSLPVTKLPVSALIHDQGFYCPNNPELTDDEVSEICGLLEAKA